MGEPSTRLRMLCWVCGYWRAKPSMNSSAISATDSALPVPAVGTLATGTPAAVAAGTSTESSPAPYCCTSLRRGERRASAPIGETVGISTSASSAVSATASGAQSNTSSSGNSCWSILQT